MPPYQQGGAFQRWAAVSHRLRSPFCSDNGELPLPKPLRSAILTRNRRISGECLLRSVGLAQEGERRMLYIRVGTWRSRVAAIGLATAFIGWLEHPVIAASMLETGDTMGITADKPGVINLTLTEATGTVLSLGDLSITAVNGKSPTAAQKATMIAAAVNTKTNMDAGWTANVIAGTTLQFLFKGLPVKKITEAKDTTQERKTFVFAPVEEATYAYTLSALSTTGAAGVNGDGDPAFVEIDTPLGDTGDVGIIEGESLSAIITALLAALPTGVDVQRTADTSFVITEIGPDTFAEFQTADNNLSDAITAQEVPEPASWWLLAAGCLGLLTLRRRRSVQIDCVE
jgi:hypothetical protein